MRPRRSRDRAWHHPLERVWCISIRSWLLLGSSQLRIRRLRCPPSTKERTLWQTRRVVQRHHGGKHEVLGASPYGLYLYARWLLLVANFSERRMAKFAECTFHALQ